jgi:hypothetical protein
MIQQMKADELKLSAILLSLLYSLYSCLEDGVKDGECSTNDRNACALVNELERNDHFEVRRRIYCHK